MCFHRMVEREPSMARTNEEVLWAAAEQWTLDETTRIKTGLKGTVNVRLPDNHWKSMGKTKDRRQKYYPNEMIKWYKKRKTV